MNDAAPRLSWSNLVQDLSTLLKNQEIDTPLFLVGGAVRDAYLHGAITDVDIAVDGDAVALARQAADWLDADIYVMDRERGVARVLLNRGGERVCVDFARLRGATLDEDLRDRDFTMNAMATDLLGDIDRLIDPLGGSADLQKKILRRCSAEAIKNDPIRALRAVRLSTQFRLKIQPDTAADIHAQAGALRQCSGERIRDEFFKLLSLDRAARGLRVLLHLSLLQEILPRSAFVGASESEGWTGRLAIVERTVSILKAISSGRTDNTAAAFDLGMLTIQLDRFRAALQAHIGREYGGARSHGELLALAALLPDRDDVDVSALKLSAEEARNVTRAVKNLGLFSERGGWSVLDQHRFWHGLRESGIDVILLALAEYLAAQGNELRQRDWLDKVEIATDLLNVYFHRYDEIVDPPLLLNGRDIQQQLQINPGPLVGKLLKALREAQVTGEVASTSEARHFIARQVESRRK